MYGWDRRPHRTDPSDEEGFTLIELMTVVLIIGILVGIAMPTFLGARSRAQDRAVQADLRNGLAAGLSYFAEAQSWTGFDASEGTSIEPSLVWLDGGDPPVGQISIQVHAGQDLLIVGLSGTGTYFCLAQVQSNPATLRGNATTFAGLDTVAECTGGW